MAPKARKQLKERHKQILDVIRDYTEKNGYAPSYREICARTDITSTSMVKHVIKSILTHTKVQK